MQRKKKRNDWKTWFPDVSVQSPLPDSRRRWILNKRILAMEDEAIAHFYVWSFKCFHVSPSGEEERAKHRGKRVSSPQTLRWVSWLRSARRWTTTISRETNTSMHTLHTHLRAHTPGNIDYISSKWAQTVTQTGQAVQDDWLLLLELQLKPVWLPLSCSFSLVQLWPQQSANRNVLSGCILCLQREELFHSLTDITLFCMQHDLNTKYSSVHKHCVCQTRFWTRWHSFIQRWASWFSQTPKKWWHVFLKNKFLQSYDSQCF